MKPRIRVNCSSRLLIILLLINVSLCFNLKPQYGLELATTESNWDTGSGSDDDYYAGREEVQDVFYSTEAYLTYNYQKNSAGTLENCGSDNICVPDLKLEVKADDSHLAGRDALVSIEVLVTNQGEDAFDASFLMNIPDGLKYKGTRRISEVGGTRYSCSAPLTRTNSTLKCDIGNPLPAGQSVNFKVVLEASQRGGRVNFSPVYDFHMEASAANEAAEDRLDNIAMKTVGSGAGPIVESADFSITGSSFPSDLQYDSSMYKELSVKLTKYEAYKRFVEMLHEAEIGPQVVQIYDVHNTGDSDIDEVEVYINWPAETLDGDPLMYLMDQPETLGNVRCDYSPHVNTANIRSDQVLQKKSFLSRSGSPIRQQAQPTSRSGTTSSRDINSRNDLEKFLRGTYTDGSNVRGFEIFETWNSTSVNGGPAVTHYSSKNRTITAGRDGRVRVSETSTERIIPNEFSGAEIDSSSSSNRYNTFEESSTQSRYDFEAEQQERTRQMEEFKKRLELQAIEQQRRIDEEKQRKEENRENIYRTSYTSRTQTQTQTETRTEDQIRVEEQRRQVQIERRRLEQERIRLEEEKRTREDEQLRRMDVHQRQEEERRRVEEERKQLEHEKLHEQERAQMERERQLRDNDEKRRQHGMAITSRTITHLENREDDRAIEIQRRKVEQQRRENEERLQIEQQQRVQQEEMRRVHETSFNSRSHSTQTQTEKTEDELEEERRLKYYDRWNTMARPAPGNNIGNTNGIKTGQQPSQAEIERQRKAEEDRRRSEDPRMRENERRRQQLVRMQEEERIRFEQERRAYGANFAPPTANQDDSDEVEAQRIKEEQEERARQALEESRRAHEVERKREEKRKLDELERIRQAALRLSQEQQKLLREQKIAEEKERVRLQEKRRFEEEQKRQRMELERLRAESAIRAQQEEEERRRYESTLTLSQSQSQTQSQGWNQDQDIHRRTLEQQMQEEEARLQMEQMRRAQEEQKRRKEEFIRTQGQVQVQTQGQGRRNSSRYSQGSANAVNGEGNRRTSSHTSGGSHSSGGAEYSSSVTNSFSGKVIEENSKSKNGRRRMQSVQDGESYKPGLITGAYKIDETGEDQGGMKTFGMDLGVLGSKSSTHEGNSIQSSSSGGASRSSSSNYQTSSGQDSSQGSSGSRYYQGGNGFSAGVSGDSGSSGTATRGQSGSSSFQTSGSTLGGSSATRNSYSSSSSGRQSSSSSHSSRAGATNSQDNSARLDLYDSGESSGDFEDNQDVSGTQNGGRSWGSSSSYSYSNSQPHSSHHESVDRSHLRAVREVSSSYSDPLCKLFSCVSVRCVAGPMSRNSQAQIALRLRLVAYTLDKLAADSNESEVKLSTMGIGHITKLPHVGQPANDEVKNHEIFVTAVADKGVSHEIVNSYM